MSRKITLQKSALQENLMRKSCFKIAFLTLLGLLLFAAAPDSLAQTADDAQVQGRDLVPVFESARLPAASGKQTTKKQRKPANATVVNQTNQANNSQPTPVYQRIKQKVNSGKVNSEDRPKRRPNQSNPAPNLNQTAQQSKRPKQSNNSNQSKRPPVSNSNNNDLAIENAQQIGVTIWQLFENNQITGAETLADSLGGRQRILTPVRAAFDTLFQNGDLVRLSIEAAKRGYLYIVNEELYQDGTTGAPVLVFPSKRINNGANLVKPGKLIELPDARSNPFYFELRPQNAAGKTLLAEVLTVIVTDRPIANLKTGTQPLEIARATVNQWRARWAGRAEIFEPASSNRTAYTRAEREAAAGARQLTHGDPLPNTVFLVENKRTGGALVTVPLWYEND